METMKGAGRQHKANTPAGIMDEDQDDPIARVRVSVKFVSNRRKIMIPARISTTV